ncbi:riboflavin biosynthesis protein RibF [Oscillospiraceae bacterium PP1C4]
MQVYGTIKQVSLSGRSSVALGYFDGLHIGHAAVIGCALQGAKSGLIPCVFTFTMHHVHPAGKSIENEIITDSEKYYILKKWGVKAVLSPDFSEFKDMSPAEFVDEVLVRRLHAGAVCCGNDFRFGQHASADVQKLAALCGERGIKLNIVPAVTCQGERVSSTRIRELLGAGEVEAAAAMLGRAFSYNFTVVQGKQLGRKIDSPTINQHMPADFVKLKYGVYASVTMADGELKPSVTNIGVRPTTDTDTAVYSETYIYGFSGNLYGKNVEVRLLQFIRSEQKFSSVDALRAQIYTDTQSAVPIAERYIENKERICMHALQLGNTML